MTARFWLGVHETAWLDRTDVGLMVSHRRLAKRFRLPRAAGPWVLDSGGFTELTLHGEWQSTAADYAAAVRRYGDEIGGLEWAAPQDWMCEPFVTAKTGLSVAEHQARTVGNYVELRALGAPVIPVVQGYTLDEYHRCVDRYRRAGVDLTREPIVGIGSVCRRQATTEAAVILRSLTKRGLRLHGFGLKLAALDRLSDELASADSMAWSFRARNAHPLPGCTHKSCANCLRFALRWRDKVDRRIGVPSLFRATA